MRVHRQRQQLDAQIDRQQAVGRDQHEDAEQRRQAQHVVLAAAGCRAAPGSPANRTCAVAIASEAGELQQRSQRVGDVQAVEQQRALRRPWPNWPVSAHADGSASMRQRGGQAAALLAGEYTSISRIRQIANASQISGTAGASDRCARRRDHGMRLTRDLAGDGLLHQVLHRGFHHVQQRRRPDAQQQHRQRQHPEHQELAAVEVLQRRHVRRWPPARRSRA